MLYLILNPKIYTHNNAAKAQKAGADYQQLLATKAHGSNLLSGVPQQGTQAYVVSKQGARRITEQIRHDGGMQDAIDMIYFNYTKARKLDVFSVLKEGALVENDGGTFHANGKPTDKSTVAGTAEVKSLYEMALPPEEGAKAMEGVEG